MIGALSRDRSDSVPEGFGEHIEWIDTERDGVHALGNLPQRIRQGRVAGVIILDRAVKHKHSEPALAAARDAHVPTAFAGQGGRASLERALTQIEGMLGAQQQPHARARSAARREQGAQGVARSVAVRSGRSRASRSAATPYLPCSSREAIAAFEAQRSLTLRPPSRHD